MSEPIIPFDVKHFVPAPQTFLVMNDVEDNATKDKVIVLDPSLREGPVKRVVAVGESCGDLKAEDKVVVNMPMGMAKMVFRCDDGENRFYYLFPYHALLGSIKK